MPGIGCFSVSVICLLEKILRTTSSINQIFTKFVDDKRNSLGCVCPFGIF
ncbi:hypothetical protein EZS27_015256 [termite gut metagenome]|uniref:Uncharacterized protein n=1 Tax=termite gut metagenome TaxID=433724 RepID=A0A5J4RRH3_9ZZZZ